MYLQTLTRFRKVPLIRTSHKIAITERILHISLLYSFESDSIAKFLQSFGLPVLTSYGSFYRGCVMCFATLTVNLKNP